MILDNIQYGYHNEYNVWTLYIMTFFFIFHFIEVFKKLIIVLITKKVVFVKKQIC